MPRCLNCLHNSRSVIISSPPNQVGHGGTRLFSNVSHLSTRIITAFEASWDTWDTWDTSRNRDLYTRRRRARKRLFSEPCYTILSTARVGVYVCIPFEIRVPRVPRVPLPITMGVCTRDTWDKHLSHVSHLERRFFIVLIDDVTSMQTCETTPRLSHSRPVMSYIRWMSFDQVQQITLILSTKLTI